jgi:hypothetical protein
MFGIFLHCLLTANEFLLPSARLSTYSIWSLVVALYLISLPTIFTYGIPCRTQRVAGKMQNVGRIPYLVRNTLKYLLLHLIILVVCRLVRAQQSAALAVDIPIGQLRRGMVMTSPKGDVPTPCLFFQVPESVSFGVPSFH